MVELELARAWPTSTTAFATFVWRTRDGVVSRRDAQACGKWCRRCQNGQGSKCTHKLCRGGIAHAPDTSITDVVILLGGPKGIQATILHSLRYLIFRTAAPVVMTLCGACSACYYAIKPYGRVAISELSLRNNEMTPVDLSKLGSTLTSKLTICEDEVVQQHRQPIRHCEKDYMNGEEKESVLNFLPVRFN